MLAAFAGLSQQAHAQVKPNNSCSFNVPAFTPRNGAGCVISNAYIKRVETKGGIANLINPSVCDSITAPFYVDYTPNTNLFVRQDAGKTIDVVVQFQGMAQNINTGRFTLKIFIDWNNDGDFTVNPNTPLPSPAPTPISMYDLDEYIAPFGWNGVLPSPHQSTGNTNVTNQSVTVKVAVPGHAKEGKLRMRVMASALSNAAPPPDWMNDCYNGNGDGETEDYTFEVINPCLPPNVISTAGIKNHSAEITWTNKPNAEEYEYLIKGDPTPPTGIGYSYTKLNRLSIDTFQCDTKYYIFVRSVCDKEGTSALWKRSDWRMDSFKTHACCEIPNVTIDRIEPVNRTARISWDPVYSAIGYEYAYSTNTTPPVQGNYTTSNVVVLNGLNPSTRYYVFVRSRCNPTPLSDGWDIKNFRSSATSSIDDVTGVAQFIDAYPNPMSDKLIVKLTGEIGNNGKLTLIDLTGKVVYNASVNNSDEISINTASFPSGMYIVKYSDDNRSEVTKVTKQ